MPITWSGSCQPKVLPPAQGFLNLPEETPTAGIKTVIAPFGLERTVSYGKGTSGGPAAIIAASAQVELFNRRLGREPWAEMGLVTLEDPLLQGDLAPLGTDDLTHEGALRVAGDIVHDCLRAGTFPVVLGGEHSILCGTAQGLARVYGAGNFSLLHFDAHLDLRPEYEHSPVNHACAVHSAMEVAGNCASIGIRNTAIDEQPVIRQLTDAGRLEILWASKLQHPPYLEQAIKRMLSLLRGKPVYLTFDVDVFGGDTIGSSTGTPEPGGIGWYTALALLREACKDLEIIGAEFVELAPNEGQHAPDFAIARLIYEFLCSRIPE